MDKRQPLLLNDEQMRKFIAEGFLLLRTDFPEEFHLKLSEQLKDVYDKEGNPGNNLLPRIRELQQVFDHPIITGALTSVLGPHYMMHAHRHGHYNAAPKPGGWHKDSYWGYKRMRNHHPWWAMIMYFPQDTPVELGPTGLFPGTQNYEARAFLNDDMAEEVLASGKAGTFALIHYDIWHRATANIAGKERFMLKFEFMRTEAPSSPSWDCQDPVWRKPESYFTPIAEHELIWKETWNWLSGQIGSIADSKPADDQAIQKLALELSHDSEPVALNAVYELAARGDLGRAALLQALHHEHIHISRLAAYGLSAAGKEALPGLQAALQSERVETIVHAVFALGELRHLAESAIPSLYQLLKHHSELVRRAVVEALGMIGRPVDQVVDGLIHCLRDSDMQVRFMAGLSLSRLGPAAAAAVPQLELALNDENRYVRAHAAEALRYIDTEQARDVLIHFLFQSRWCPNTTPASTFYP